MFVFLKKSFIFDTRYHNIPNNIKTINSCDIEEKYVKYLEYLKYIENI